VLVVEDSGCAQRLYLDGVVDAILALQADAIRDLGRAKVPGLMRGTSLNTEFLRVRFRPRRQDERPAVTAALHHPRLRLALARAIDREVLAGQVMEGMGVPATTFTPAALADYLPYKPPVGHLAYDLPQAKADLAVAVADLGAIPAFEVLTMSTPLERLRSVEFVVDCWRRHLGLDVHLVIRPSIEVRAQEDAGQFDLGRGSWMGDYIDPTTFLDVWRSDSGINRGRFADAEYDALMTRAASADQTHRWRLLQQAEERLVEQAPFIPLVHTTCNMLVRPGLAGIAANPIEYVWLDEVGWR
jgi:oligopeptide transport system substrate-binding protein